MVTVLRVAGLRFIIFVDDHEPAHVHVFGDGQAKIDLLGADGLPELSWVDGMKKRCAPRHGSRQRTSGRVAGALERYPWLN